MQNRLNKLRSRVPEKTKKKVNTVSTKHFRMKSLKKKTEIKRRFKWEFALKYLRVYINITATIGRNTHRFHVLTAHVFNAPYLSRHLYSHAEVMYECTKCEKGFAFNSEFVAHKHINDNDYVCMTS